MYLISIHHPQGGQTDLDERKVRKDSFTVKAALDFLILEILAHTVDSLLASRHLNGIIETMFRPSHMNTRSNFFTTDSF